MAVDADSRTPHFGVRDFLFYFFPGSVVLAALLVLFPVVPAKLPTQPYGALAFSLWGILLAYYIGQLVYCVAYLPRCVLDHFAQGKRRELLKKGINGTDFWEVYVSCVHKHTTFYVSEVFRVRALSRFCAAMVFPTVLLGLVLSFTWDVIDRSVGSVITVLGAAGFAYRYYRYAERWTRYVELSDKVDIQRTSSDAPQSDQS